LKNRISFAALAVLFSAIGSSWNASSNYATFGVE
jgi:hypothetical protein